MASFALAFKTNLLCIFFQFLTELKNIGRRLTGLASKEVRNGQLRAELTTLNLNLPARVWLPLHDKPHFVLRIPLVTAAVLNSKDKVGIVALKCDKRIYPNEFPG